MFGIGFFELCVIAIAALVVVGPQKLPELMKQFGRFFVQIRRASNDVRSTFDTIVHDAENEIRKEEMKLKKVISHTHELTTALPALPSEPTPEASEPAKNLWEKASL